MLEEFGQKLPQYKESDPIERPKDDLFAPEEKSANQDNRYETDNVPTVPLGVGSDFFDEGIYHDRQLEGKKEFDKRMLQLSYIAERLEDTSGQEALNKIIDILKNKSNIFLMLDNEMEAYQDGAFTFLQKPSRIKTMLTSLYLGTPGAAIGLFGSIFAGLSPEVEMAVMGGGYATASAGIYWGGWGRYAKRKNENVYLKNNLESVGSFFNPEILRTMIDHLEQASRRLKIDILSKNSDIIHEGARDVHTQQVQFALQHLNNEFEKSEPSTYKALDTWESRSKDSLDQIDYVDIFRNEENKFLENDHAWSVLSGAIDTLHEINDVVQGIDINHVLPKLDIMNEMQQLINACYEFSDNARSVGEIVDNIIDAYQDNPGNIKDPDLVRLIIRSGLHQKDTQFSRDILKNDLEKILQSEYVKFLYQNDFDMKNQILESMAKDLHEIEPFEDEIVRRYLAFDVTSATDLNDMHDPSFLKEMALEGIMQKIQQATDPESKKYYIDQYKYRNELLVAESYISRVKKFFAKGKRFLYKGIMKSAGHNQSE